MSDLILLSEYELYVQTLYPNDEPSANTIDDFDLLSFLISAASEKVQTICNRSFISAEYTEVQDGHNTRSLLLDQSPITALSAVVSLGADGTTSNTYDLDFVRIDNSSGIIHSTSTFFPDGFLNIQIVYTAGYAIDTIPKDLKEICLNIVNREFRKNKTIDATATEVKLGDYTIKRSATSDVDISTNDMIKLKNWIKII